MIRFIPVTFLLVLLSHQISAGAGQANITQIDRFGDNPGELKMFLYLPEKMNKKVPLVVLLHGCLQEAIPFAKESGWASYAQKHNFALLVPEQQKSNNRANCFNWFLNDDNQRESGETASLFHMVTYTLKNASIDMKKIFITGFSAGASMTEVMLANYPSLFSAGAVVAGVPYGCANSTIRGLTCMAGYVKKSAKKWGSYIREISSDQKTFPRISIWSGRDDKVVNSSNADQTLKQWLNLHYLTEKKYPTEMITEEQFYTKKSYMRNNDIMIEYYMLDNYPHAQPIFTGTEDINCGTESRFVKEAGICAAYHQAKFFKII